MVTAQLLSAATMTRSNGSFSEVARSSSVTIRFLVLEVFRVELQVHHAVRLHDQHGVEAGGRDVRLVARLVEVGGGVLPPPRR